MGRTVSQVRNPETTRPLAVAASPCRAANGSSSPDTTSAESQTCAGGRSASSARLEVTRSTRAVLSARSR